MKKLFLIAILVFLGNPLMKLAAQEEVPADTSVVDTTDGDTYEMETALKYWQEKYEVVIQGAIFEDVAQAIKEIVESSSCAVIQFTNKTSDAGLGKAVIESDFCIIAMGDSSYRIASQFSLLKGQETMGHITMPFIPGGRWKNMRIKYKLIIKESEDESIAVMMKLCEISGEESYVTRKFHFWESNGVLETAFMDKIKQKFPPKE
jgi:hypothetical protein